MIKRRKYIHRAINRYGIENFEWHILRECSSKEELDIYEKKFIVDYFATNKRYGYNLTFGKVFERNKITHKKMMKNLPNKDGCNNPMYGKAHTDVSKEKMRIRKKNFVPWNKGLKTGSRSTDTKNKISKKMIGNVNAKYK